MGNMDQIVEQLIKLNEKDCLDILGILIPIILTIVIIIQNIVYLKKTQLLQKQIQTRDQINQFHEEILSIYNIYYEFYDAIIKSGFLYNLKSANITLVFYQMNDLNNLRMLIGRRQDLAKLLFGRNNEKLYNIIEARCKIAMDIIDKCIDYINSNKLYQISENAWDRITANNPMIFRYNYNSLIQNGQLYGDFIKLCQSDELTEIESLIKDYQDKHSYDNYDKYFEEYFALERLQK